MNIKRILGFALLLLLLRIVVSLVFPGGLEFDADGYFLYFGLLRYLVDGLAVAVFFFGFVRVQVGKIYGHALLVVLIQALLGFALQLALMADGSWSPLWFLDFFIVVMAMLVGVEVGRRYGKRT